MKKLLLLLVACMTMFACQKETTFVEDNVAIVDVMELELDDWSDNLDPNTSGKTLKFGNFSLELTAVRLDDSHKYNYFHAWGTKNEKKSIQKGGFVHIAGQDYQVHTSRWSRGDYGQGVRADGRRVFTIRTHKAASVSSKSDSASKGASASKTSTTTYDVDGNPTSVAYTSFTASVITYDCSFEGGTLGHGIRAPGGNTILAVVYNEVEEYYTAYTLDGLWGADDFDTLSELKDDVVENGGFTCVDFNAPISSTVVVDKEKCSVGKEFLGGYLETAFFITAIGSGTIDIDVSLGDSDLSGFGIQIGQSGILADIDSVSGSTIYYSNLRDDRGSGLTASSFGVGDELYFECVECDATYKTYADAIADGSFVSASYNEKINTCEGQLTVTFGNKETLTEDCGGSIHPVGTMFTLTTETGSATVLYQVVSDTDVGDGQHGNSPITPGIYSDPCDSYSGE